MFRLKQSATLLAVLLLASGSAALAQNQCNQTSVDNKPQASVQRQKPYVPSTPRSIAPRELPPVDQDEAARAANAAEIVSTMPGRTMVRDEKAIAVIPGVKKGAFLFGARWGKGLLTMRDPDGYWMPPAFIQITGGNFGLQVGFQSTDLVLVFTNEDAIRGLLRGKLTLNADAAAVAGPAGRTVQAGVPISFNSGIYAYSRSTGLFAGASLDGAAITIDDSSNEKVYGKYISGDEILLHRRVETNTSVAPFLNAMETYSPGPNRRQARTSTQD